MLNIKTLQARDVGFEQTLKQLTRYGGALDEKVDQIAAQILADVRARGDAAVLEYSNRFDRLSAKSIADLTINTDTCQAAFDSIPAAQRDALQVAAERIRRFHERQITQSWQYTDDDGMQLGQRISPLDRVGVYVPGGKATYPSSVLMNIIPAKVAGVAEIIMVVPTPLGERNPLVLAAAYLAGVDRVFCVGGAQAIAALAYGTESIPAVDKIVGPGNAYVAAAKRRVFGLVGIDMVAGPSEIAVIADESANPDWVAMDLFSQAEHDEVAQCILLYTKDHVMQAVHASMLRLLPTMPRADIIQASLNNRGLLIKCKSLPQCCAVSNLIAPEHLEVATDKPEELLPLIKHAGAVFLGHYASEALGDYCAGPNHVLPTSGSARFSSPLGVYDFQKRSSLIQASAVAAAKLGPIAQTLALGEGLHAHAAAAASHLNYKLVRGVNAKNYLTTYGCAGA